MERKKKSLLGRNSVTAFDLFGDMFSDDDASDDPDRTPLRDGELPHSEIDKGEEEDSISDADVVETTTVTQAIRLPKNAPEWVEARDGGLFCLVCCAANVHHKDGVWTKLPCKNKDVAGSIRKHPQSVTHKQAIELRKVVPMEDHVVKLNDRAFEALKKRFRSVYFLAKEDLAKNKLEKLLELEMENGCYAGLEDLFTEHHSTYDSRDFLEESLRVMATVVHAAEMKKVQSSQFIGVVVDESMDIANQSQLAMYYRYCFNGKKRVSFAGILRLNNGTAPMVTAAVRWRLLKDNLSIARMACLGSDGAAVMLGVQSGVAVRLTSLNPMLLGIHCGGHRGSLASKGAAEDVPYFAVTFFPITEQLGRYYSDSATRTSTLEQHQKASGKTVRKVILSAFTRWLSHDGVTNVIHIRFVPICKDLLDNSTSDATALGLLTTICSRDYIASLLLQRDNLPSLARFNLLFQDQNTDWSLLEIELPVLLEFIENQIEHPGPHYAQSNDFIANVELEGLTVRSVAGRGHDWLETNRVQYLKALKEHMTARFPNVPLLTALFCLLNPHAYPADDNSLSDFGWSSLDVVLDHYGKAEGGVLNIRKTKDEWPAVRKWLHRFRGKKSKVAVDVYDDEVEWDVMDERPTKKVTQERLVPVSAMLEEFLNNETLVELNPFFVILMIIFIVLTKDSSDCERGFSVMKRIKTAVRNRLGQAALEQLMYISINGPSLPEFDFDIAVRVFCNLANRRLQTSVVNEVARKEALELSKYVWGEPVSDGFLKEEEDRNLDAKDSSRILTGHAPTGVAPRQKRKEAAEVVIAHKKSRREENAELTQEIVKANMDPLVPDDEIDEPADEVGEKCNVCSSFSSRGANLMLLCDGVGCSFAIHMLCHTPRLVTIPIGKWFCEVCELTFQRSQQGRRRIPNSKFA